MIAPPRFAIREPFAGGLEAQVWHTCRALIDRGVEVDLYGADGSDFAAPDLAFPLPDWEAADGHATDITLPERTAAAHQRLMHELMDRLSRNLGGYDVVHNQCLYPEPLARAGELPMPMVTTLHTPPFWELTDVLNGDNGHFAAVSAHVSDAWSMLDRRPAVIHNGIDVRRWRPGPGGDDLAWFGRIVEEKAPHLAIDAARLAGRRLVIAGRVGDERYWDAEMQPRLGPDVTVVGALHQRDLSTMVGRCAAVLVTPMWPEPFGLVAAEAAACGTPVVAFAAGALPEVIENGVMGTTVPQGDVAAMARAVEHVAAYDRGAVRTSARSRFGVRAMADRYLQLYDRLVGSRQEATA